MNIKTFFLSLFAFILSGLSSCSRGPDVRIVLCQDMTSMQLKTQTSELIWKETEIIEKQYDDAQIIVKYSAGNDTGQSICHYKYEADVDVDLGDELIDPLSIYSTYPHQFNFKDKVISGKELSTLVNKVMLKQGKSILKKIST